MLCQAASETGGLAIQNRGTLGGNIVNASPAADSPPALLAYDAEIELVSSDGSRWLPYHGFHTGYNLEALWQLAKAFRRPFVHDGQYSTFRKRRFGAPADDRPPPQFVVWARAEGATIVTHRLNKPYYEKALTGPRTLAPDTLVRPPTTSIARVAAVKAFDDDPIAVERDTEDASGAASLDVPLAFELAP